MDTYQQMSATACPSTLEESARRTLDLAGYLLADKGYGIDVLGDLFDACEKAGDGATKALREFARVSPRGFDGARQVLSVGFKSCKGSV